MPTPVSVARQCLTPDASRALDEAVSVARRRNHAQTTSLHALSAFLSLPSSSLLRDACARLRSSTYSSRLQFRALELCFSASLDRLPSSPPQDEPPISNSFMAAIKRSQANQRRHPETFQFHFHPQHSHQQQQLEIQQMQQQSSLSCVKVELQQLILSILDDPVVSRVFAEAGFRSCDLKLAILRPPPPPISRNWHGRRRPPPPLFLCNLPGGADSESPRPNFSFPFLGFPDKDDNCRRIAEVLVRKKDRNPLLVGVAAVEAVRNFGEIVESGKGGSVLPVDISGLSFISIDKEISSEGLLGSKFRELGQFMESYSGSGVVISFGDLKVFTEDGSVDAVSFAVSQLTRLLELHRGKLWLMGAAESYEMYLKFLMKFPSIEKDWDLQLLPITSARSPMDGGFHSRPHSLTESFIPFGGFFSIPSDMKGPLSSTYQPTSRCARCNEKYEQEVSAVKGGCALSVADQYQASIPSWLQVAELNANKELDVAKAKDDGTVLNAKITGLQKKWDEICRRLNHSSPVSEADICRTRPQTFTGVMGFPFVAEKKGKAGDNNSGSNVNATPKQSDDENLMRCTSTRPQKISTLDPDARPVVSEAKNENLSCEPLVRPSMNHWLLKEGLHHPPCHSDSSTHEGHASPSCPPVTTDLGLGTLYAAYKEPERPTVPAHRERLQDLTDCLPSKDDLVSSNVSNLSVQSSSFSGSDLSGHLDPNDFKSLWRSLSEKVGRQNEAIQAVSQTISRCRTGNERRRGATLKRDIWFSFVGPDRAAKKRTALALAEIVFGNREDLISVDLSYQDGFTRTNTVLGFQETNDYDEKFRGKMAVDYIAEEISKKPMSVVLLENINKADLLLQTSLSQAIKTGKFSDSHRREISINNAIFVATSDSMKDNQASSIEKLHTHFSEEAILGAPCLEMQIMIGCNPGGNIMLRNSNVLVTSRKETLGYKRKLVVASSDVNEQCETFEWPKRAHKTTRYLDLNLPIEEAADTEDADCCGSSDSSSDSVSQNSELWLEEVFNQMDETVVFKPFDFDALADRILKEISVMFRNVIGSQCLLEIDSKVMEQILAAAWVSDSNGAVEGWIEQVLGKSFSDARQRYAFTRPPLMKLVACEGLYMKEQAPAVCLPSRIILN